MNLEQAGYGQANLFEDTMNRLSAEFQHKANMVNSDPPKYPEPPTATGTTEIIQQVLAQNQDIMILLSANSGKIGIKNTNRPPTTSTGTLQGQTIRPMHEYFDKYF